jgi:hypothetical protein
MVSARLVVGTAGGRQAPGHRAVPSACVAERNATVAVCEAENMEAGTPPDRADRDERPRPPRVFLSYAHDSDAHREAVRNLWVFLCANGVDARIDRVAAERRQDWTLWMEEQVATADHVLVIASPAYKQRAGHEAEPDQGRGVQYEARLVRNLFYENQSDLQRFLPVVLPGGSTDDVPTFLSPAIATVYRVSAFTIPGAESLLRVLHGWPGEVQPTIGPAPDLRTREHTLGGTGASNRTKVEPTRTSSMSPESEIGRVFLCHSSGDKERVRALYWRLREDDVRCWFDEEDLLPGQNWEYEIKKALRSCRYVLACLSKASINKGGFVQKELRDALDLADEQPEDSIFLVPVRLEECEVPTRLRHLHYVDLFEDIGYSKLVRALRHGTP